WSAEDNVAWRAELPGNGWSSPALRDDKIYLTASTGSVDDENVSLRVLCVDANDGSLQWNVEVFAPATDLAKQMHEKNSLASPTLVLEADQIIAHFGHLGTASLNYDGDIEWRQQELTYEPQHGNGGSPVVVDEHVIFSCDGLDRQEVAALDRRSGKVVWRTPRDTQAQRTFSFSTPLAIEVDGRQLVVSPGSGYVGAYAADDGQEIWRVGYGEGFSVVPRPVFANGHVYVTSGFMRATLLAIDPRHAEGDVTENHVAWRHSRGVPTTPSIVVVDNLAFFVSDSGVASCLDATTGKSLWQERLGGGFSASPVVAEGRVYFTNEEGKTFVVNAARDYELLAENELGERTLASAAVADGALYLRTEKALYRLGERP
ncbi:MAG: PQQ-binding-like beta-propeller repeat protein, partial [Planctomycetales bacterium]|nr:PQQ-binding-like beta-propeller repeat protein [Planctomycetales bacterium]